MKTILKNILVISLFFLFLFILADVQALPLDDVPTTFSGNPNPALYLGLFAAGCALAGFCFLLLLRRN